MKVKTEVRMNAHKHSEVLEESQLQTAGDLRLERWFTIQHRPDEAQT